MKKNLSSLVLIANVLVASLATAQELPTYEPKQLSAESLTSIGSDAMDNLMQPWVAAYRLYQPEVKIEITSSGSASAPAALVEGNADIGPMARPFKDSERQEFFAKFGFEPTQIHTALTAVVLYVAKQNPIQSISFAELDAIYSAERRQGRAEPVRNWADLGVGGDLRQQEVFPIGQLDGTPSDSFFRQQVLLLAPMHERVTRVADTAALAELITAKPQAIGFGTLLDTVPPQLKVLPVMRRPSDSASSPTLANIVSGEYPLARYLNVYVVHSPTSPLEEGVRDFLRFILSKQGQMIVAAEGMIPLPAAVAREQLSKLQ